jgi:hypothetical protein
MWVIWFCMLQSGISWASWYFQNTKTGAEKKNITRNGEMVPMKLTMVSLVFYGVFKMNGESMDFLYFLAGESYEMPGRCRVW